jgi:hypothetical protein
VKPNSRVEDLAALADGAAQAGANRHLTASCYDWHGNAPPSFFRDRIFALVGLELIEGELLEGRTRETGRVQLAGVPANRH